MSDNNLKGLIPSSKYFWQLLDQTWTFIHFFGVYWWLVSIIQCISLAIVQDNSSIEKLWAKYNITVHTVWPNSWIVSYLLYDLYYFSLRLIIPPWVNCWPTKYYSNFLLFEPAHQISLIVGYLNVSTITYILEFFTNGSINFCCILQVQYGVPMFGTAPCTVCIVLLQKQILSVGPLHCIVYCVVNTDLIGPKLDKKYGWYNLSK